MLNIGNFSVEFKNNIPIVTNKNGVVKDDLDFIRTSLKETMDKTYDYMMYRDPLGYYHCWDFFKNESIYCITMNKTYACELVQKEVKSRRIE
jgi:hypothetical protein